MSPESLLRSLREEKNNYLNAKKGSEFEERVRSFLKLRLNYSPILKQDVGREDWRAIKTHIGKKLGTDFLNVPRPDLRRTFIFQPYGSQQFPDFIVFTDKKVIPLEIKYSTRSQSKPIWNSNVPRANALYIFGSYGMKDITFFLGENVLDQKHREFLYNFFSDIRAKQNEARKSVVPLDATKRGFTPYIRAAFDQRKHEDSVVTSFFAHPERKLVEDAAINKVATF